MGNFRPLPTPCVIKLLLSYGFDCDRSKGSHFQYKRRGSRTVPIWENEKEIPAFHLRSVSHVIGLSMKQIYQWAADNC